MSNTKSFTVSPMSPSGIIIGLVIQTFYGWHMPETDLDMLWMGFHIFIAPTLIALAVMLSVLLIPLIIGCIIMAIGFVVGLFQKPNKLRRR